MIVSKLSFIYIQNYRIFANFNMVDADMHNSSVCPWFLSGSNTLPHRTESVFSDDSISRLSVRWPTHPLPDVLPFSKRDAGKR